MTRSSQRVEFYFKILHTKCSFLKARPSVRGKTIIPAKIYRILTKDGFIKSRRKGKYAGWAPDKIFGMLDCKSGMRMKKENRVFFHCWDDAIACGYRPCKNCKPEPGSEKGA